jgi:hypothetical protein
MRDSGYTDGFDSRLRRLVQQVGRVVARRSSPTEPVRRPVEPEPKAVAEPGASKAARPEKPKLKRGPLDQLGLAEQASQALDRLIEESAGPIVAGPWLSEVGYELLYWIPFLSWAVERRPELKERLIVLSRGGAASWYQHVGDRYVDVFEHVERETYLEALEQAAAASNGKQKQRGLEAFEQRLLERVGGAFGLERVGQLPPALMYGLFRQAFKQDLVQQMSFISRYGSLAAPDPGPLAGSLPDDYVAVRFYFNYSFPDTAENRRFVGSVLRSLVERTHVVLLNTGLRLDDHWDFEAVDSNRLVRLEQAMTASNNLEIQSVAISRARAFYGTYGGLSYLPPFYGVPSVCFYSRPERFNQCHLELAYRVYRNPGWGSFLALDVAQAPLLGALAGQAGPWVESSASG